MGFRASKCTEKIFYCKPEILFVTLQKDIKYTFVTFITQVLTSKEIENRKWIEAALIKGHAQLK